MAVTRANTTKNYAAIAKQRIRKPRTRPKSILIYGRNKKGKTYFCASAGNVLILDPEDGTDELKKAQPDVWPIRKWQDLDEAYKFLHAGNHGYDYIALDGMTRFSNMALRFVMQQQEERDLGRQPGMVQQRDYGKAGEIMKGLMYNFHSLGVGTIYTAQERQVEGEFLEEDDDVETSEVQYVPDMPKGIRTVVNSLVDVIGRIYTVRAETDNGTVIRRRLWLSPSPLYDTGYRSDHRLPDYLPAPSVPRLIQLLEEGKVQRNGTRKG